MRALKAGLVVVIFTAKSWTIGATVNTSGITAMVNTTLRMIGRPDELRTELFARTLEVRTKAPLGNPGALFAGLSGVKSWSDAGGAAYRLEVTDPEVAAPGVTRALVAAGADVLSIAESRHSLEDVYLELVGEEEKAGRA